LLEGTDRMINVESALLALSEEMKRMNGVLEELLKRQTIKEYYDTEEFADLTGLKPKTVRDYLNEGRLKGQKKQCGHGRSKQWAIPHEELLRFEREGRLPVSEEDRRCPQAA
jgi:hypothetical protein